MQFIADLTKMAPPLNPERSRRHAATGTSHVVHRHGSLPAPRAADPVGSFFRTPEVPIDTASAEHDSEEWANCLPPGETNLRLPVDAARIIENLRYERYASSEKPSITSAIVSSEGARSLYYRLRPLLNASVRKRIQRLFLRDWDSLRFPEWPVNMSVERIHEKLLSHSIRAANLKNVPFIWFWPEGASAATIVTHDVETEVGVASIGDLIDIDNTFGIKASFQLVPERRYRFPLRLIDGIRKKGCEVNVHDLDHDGNLFGRHDTFLAKCQGINEYLRIYNADGFRAGCMYRNADWYEALDASYDMSIPNVAHLEPQRGGCCTVFPYFIGNVLELPLTTVQDYSLFHILGKYSIGLWKMQVEQILNRNGLISFIVHPDYIMEEHALRTYRRLLAYLSRVREERNLWFALPGDVNRWWRERSAMELVREGGVWRISGSGRERARIAFASVKDGELKFEITSGCEAPADYGWECMAR